MTSAEADRRSGGQYLDMPGDTEDLVLQQLKNLRDGPGLTAQRLQAAPELMTALDAATPGNAQEALTLALLRQPDSSRSRALRVDLGLDLDELLERMPTPRERDVLGERRSSYASLVQRDVKTLRRWSDRAVGELRAQLSSEHFDGQIVVACGVQKRRLIGIEVVRYQKDDTRRSHGLNEGHTNPTEGPSPPMVLYGFSQRDWHPVAIHFAVSFLDETPSRAWALAVVDVSDISFGHERFPLEVVDSMARCRIDQPTRDQVYGVWWEW